MRAKKLSKVAARHYSDEQAAAGINAPLPALETFPNQYAGYEISIQVPEYTSVCPKTGLPDFATLTVTYMPRKKCVELKSFKEYLLAYRNLGIFYENACNRILDDVVAACVPVWARVEGQFRPRGGITSTITARWPRPRRGLLKYYGSGIWEGDYRTVRGKPD